MKLVDFSLSVGNKKLLENVNIVLHDGQINHILGQNGTGKSCFAKAVMGGLPYRGAIEAAGEKRCVVASYTNLPSELKVHDVTELAQKKYRPAAVQEMVRKLHIAELPDNRRLKNLSDGQRQKMKLLFFLSAEPQLLILDEVTNALDRASCLELYDFFREYSKTSDVTILNITHNLMDLEYLPGAYYLLGQKTLTEEATKEQVVDYYMKGGNAG